MGAHVLAIKDMAGLCKPYAAKTLVEALRAELGIPVHFHTHDTSGINAASILKASEAGVDVADGAIASMSGTTSQPNLNSVVAALQHTAREPAPHMVWPLLRVWTALRPDSSAAWTMTGWAHQVDGQLDQARSLLERAIDLDPENEDAALILSNLPSA